MRPPHPVQRFVAPEGTPRKARMGVATCVRHTQYSVSWPHKELHRKWHPQRVTHNFLRQDNLGYRAMRL
eukprot:4116832-Pyramimonas_sp.AAC.1